MNDLARVFKALGDPNRLRILAALHDTTFCVCDLARRVGIAQPTLSHHLKILRETRLVRAQKEGQWIYCSLNHEMLSTLGLNLEQLMADFSIEGVRA